MEIKLKIEASEDLLNAINGLANALSKTTPTEKVKTAVKKPTTEVKEEGALPQESEPKETQDVETSYTASEIKEMGQSIAAKGKKDEVKALISKYGASKLSDLAEADYNAFVKDLNAL